MKLGFVSEVVGNEVVTSTLGEWRTANNIEFDRLTAHDIRH